MESMPLISVIVPVYNAEAFLCKCIDSIRVQTYQNLEIVLVNDGSVDRSAEICNYYAQQDIRVKVLHQRNKGVSEARNYGIAMANGDYIGFVDADDWIEKEMYQSLYELIEQYEADVSIHSFFVEDSVGNDLSRTCSENSDVFIMNSKEAIKEMNYARRFAGHLCNKLFRRELFQGLFLNKDITIYEDMLFLWDVFHKANRVVYKDRKVYHYIMQPESALSSGWKESFLTVFNATEAMLKKTKKEYPELLPYAQKTVLLSCLVVAMKLQDTNKLDKIYYKKIKNRLRESFNLKSVTLFPEKRTGISVVCLMLGRNIFSCYRTCLKYMKKFF